MLTLTTTNDLAIPLAYTPSPPSCCKVRPASATFQTTRAHPRFRCLDPHFLLLTVKMTKQSTEEVRHTLFMLWRNQSACSITALPSLSVVAKRVDKMENKRRNSLLFMCL